MMHFCFLAKIVLFQKVAQNLSSRLKRPIESRTQQHTMSQFSSLEENNDTRYLALEARRCARRRSSLLLLWPRAVSYVYETNSRLACRNFRPSRISAAHDSMPQTQPCIKQRPM